ncbi:serpin family protein [Mucilaginibacter sp. L3T2-6]|uniref:serpin family protein n=1 Tax=Mucilaginibacter sp. L3T2-6 TaxID=3062491 RepID=UPI002676A294|nr:serpin family protein [Mucilaginibacter sp. L3T2-6]MDO3640596.1 serpin family protein [Mucilaginibacter sp. L3T2-6]MDV6213065.1 serpin family protein [Mucilaginibacter sp. L3T2-6]
MLSAAEQQKVTADNVFTFKLFNKLNSANTAKANIFASPLSVSFALGMTSNGAAGTTLDAFKNTLNFTGMTQGGVNSYYNNLITNLPQLDPNTTLKIANSIWYKQGFDALPAFLQTSNDSFHAKSQVLDFSDPGAKDKINKWVSDQTAGKIPSIIDNIPPDAVMYLVNALYFKSIWKEKFDKEATAKRGFMLEDSSSIQADFMNNTMHVNLFEDAGVSVAELPYSNDKYSMVIVMPKNSTVDDMVADMDADKWQLWMGHLSSTKTEVALPTFRFSYDATLNDALISLGMGIAFSKNADFSRINPNAALQITNVRHKAYIEVNEDGTTAAAATSVEVGITAAPLNQVIINRPFFFAIREMKSGLIIFTGTVYDPTK